MNKYKLYECETCGKISDVEVEIMECEASHLGLSLEEYTEFKSLRFELFKASLKMDRMKDKESEEAFHRAFNNLVDFESEHVII